MMYQTKSLRPGMTTQDPVRDAKGQILLPAGVSLGVSHIAQLLQRGISAVSVAAEETEEERMTRVGKETAWILNLFSDTEDSAELDQLRKLLLERTDAG
jgi:hypothetical protein